MDEGAVWWESDPPEVNGFEFDECPHGALRLRLEAAQGRTDVSYLCTNCGKHFIAHTVEE